MKQVSTCQPLQIGLSHSKYYQKCQLLYGDLHKHISLRSLKLCHMSHLSAQVTLCGDAQILVAQSEEVFSLACAHVHGRALLWVSLLRDPGEGDSYSHKFMAPHLAKGKRALEVLEPATRSSSGQWKLRVKSLERIMGLGYHIHYPWTSYYWVFGNHWLPFCPNFTAYFAMQSTAWFNRLL